MNDYNKFNLNILISFPFLIFNEPGVNLCKISFFLSTTYNKIKQLECRYVMFHRNMVKVARLLQKCPEIIVTTHLVKFVLIFFLFIKLKSF